MKKKREKGRNEKEAESENFEKKKKKKGGKLHQSAHSAIKSISLHFTLTQGVST